MALNQYIRIDLANVQLLQLTDSRNSTAAVSGNG